MSKNGIVLAAGKGKRMKAIDHTYNKTCYPILGKPVVEYVLDATTPLNLDKTYVIGGVGFNKLKELISSKAEVLFQEKQLGTGHAVMVCEGLITDKSGWSIILYGDTPLLNKETIFNMVKKHEKEDADITLLTAITNDPSGYNKILRDEKTQRVLGINELKEQQNGRFEPVEIDGGVYVVNNSILFKYLKQIKPDYRNELSLISIVELAVNDNLKIETYITSEKQEIFSLNNRFNLSYASKIIKKRVNMNLMMSGVSIEDPDTTYISPDVCIGQDTIIHPNTSIFGKCVIGESNEIGPNSFLSNTKIGNFNNIQFAHICDCKIGNYNKIGPYTRLRGNCNIANNTRIGNFVEMKNAVVKDNTKCAHLTYLGDCDIGANTNIGCGTITANYDGYNKSKTTIGESCFIGSGTIMVAPINIDNNSFTAAGSTITKNLDKGDLAIERCEQVNIKNGAIKILNKAKAKKEGKKYANK